MKKQAGFTLIELIVVILILGILSATALPRFVDVESEARVGAHKGVAGAYQAGVMLVHAKWLAANKPAAGVMTIDTGVNIHVNASGWPGATAAAITDAATCVQQFNTLFQQNGPVANTTNTDDYQATYGGTTCTFTDTKSTGLNITFNSNDGAIGIDDTP